MLRQKIVVIVIAIGSVIQVQGQDLQTETVEVVKNFEARLADANKQRLEPEPEVKEVTNQKFEYNIEEKLMEVEYLAPTIRPVGISTEKLDPGYNGFAKAGFGYPISPYLDAGYLFGSESSSNVLARITHHSANDKNYANQRFSDNDALLKGTLQTNRGFALGSVASRI